MAFTGTVDTTVKPPRLTVVCDFRTIGIDIHILGQTTRAEGLAPVELVDDDARTWALVSETPDGVTSVYELS